MERTTDSISPKVLSAHAPSITSGYAYINPQQIGGITIYFSEPMDPATITDSTITLTLLNNGIPVTGTVTYHQTDDAPNNITAMTASFVPNGNLAYSGNYQVTVKSGATGVKDTAGNLLASDFTSNFTTEPHPSSGSGSSGTCFISTARM